MQRTEAGTSTRRTGTNKSGDRVPPHSLDAEQSLLGAMLLSADAIAETILMVSSEEFYRTSHSHIFEAVAALYAAGEPVDPVTVSVELERVGVLDAVDGLEGLHRLQMNTPASSNAVKYASIVHECFMLRKLIGVAAEISEIGFSRPDDPIAAIDEAENMVFKVAEKQNVESMKRFPLLAAGVMQQVEARLETGGGIVGTPTGFGDLDTKLSGLKRGTLIVVGARPAMGKTSFVLNIASHVAGREHKPVLLFSLEMGHDEIASRIMSAEARVNAKDMGDGRINLHDLGKLQKTKVRLHDMPLWIDDNPNPSIIDIRSRARRLQRKAGALGLVVVDYLQLMTGRHRAESRQVEVAEISRGLKILARELQCPVIGVSQLSRGLEGRQDKHPMLSDLRESGSIEQDADVVVFLYRDEVYHTPTPDKEGLTEVIVAKHRNGPTGTVELSFVPRFTSFSTVSRQPF